MDSPSPATDRSEELCFTLLWAKAQPIIAGYVHGLLPDQAAADDIVQEVAVSAFRAFPSWQRTGSFHGWTLGIASNLLKRRWRDISRSRRVITDEGLLASLADVSAEEDDDTLEAERQALKICLQSVTGRSWDLLRLHYFEAMAASAIASRLALAEGHVRVLLHRIRATLRSCIESRLGKGTGDVRSR